MHDLGVLSPGSISKRWTFLAVLLCLVFSDVAFLAKKKPPSRPVNLNTASAAELEQVPGIGPSTAQKILEMRKSYGAFKSVDDLLSIKGIGEKRLQKMRLYLTVAKPAATLKSSQSASAPPSVKAPPPKSASAKPPAPAKPPSSSSDDEEPQ